MEDRVRQGLSSVRLPVGPRPVTLAPLLAVVALLTLASEGRAEESLGLWGPLKPGPHAVGFQVVNARDSSRHVAGALGGRPIQISLWYPAEASGSPSMTYGDYVALAASERTLESPTSTQMEETLAAYRRFLAGTGAPEPAIALWLTASMAANRDAKPAPGAFPLVLIAQGNGGGAPDHALLAEYLTSHGFLVATSPSQARLGDTMTSEADILRSAEAQARDLAFVLRRLGSEPAAKRGPVGLVGYSFGGRSALLLAGREPRVAALVSLDSGIATKTGRGWLPRRALESLALRAPILHVFEETDDFMAPDLTLLARLRRSDRHLLRVSDFSHFEFITYGMASAVVPELNPEAEHRRLATKVETVFAYVLAFLGESLAADPDAKKTFARTPSENGFPSELFAFVHMLREDP